MTAARKHLSHGLLLLLLAPVLLRQQGRNPAETCGLRSPYRRLQDTGRESRGDAPGKRHREVDTPSNGYSHSKAYSICVIPRYD